MKALLIAALLCAGCALPQWDNGDAVAFWIMYQNAVQASQPMQIQPLIEPLQQPGSGMSFMCRDAFNRRDSGAAMIFC